MTNKRNKSLPCLMVMAAMLLSAFAAGGPVDKPLGGEWGEERRRPCRQRQGSGRVIYALRVLFKAGRTEDALERAGRAEGQLISIPRG